MAWLQKMLRFPKLSILGSRSLTVRPISTGHNLTFKPFGRQRLSIPEINFTGECATSPNGRFMLLWREGAFINDKRELGRYVLIDEGCLVVDEQMERPHDGKIANNGFFILNDWGPRGKLSGSFHAFSTNGRTILSRHFTANILNNGLSDDGRLAVCQTCNSPGSPDSSILAVFNLAAGREISNWSPESGWAHAYEFPQGSNRIRLVRHDRESLDYSLEGEFIDRRKWFRMEVARGNFYVIKKALKEREDTTGLTSAQLRAGAKVAIADADQRLRAELLRLLGEIEEQAGDVCAALIAYDQALAINPKVGVAKRAATLRRNQ